MQQSGRPCPAEPTASGLIPLCISMIGGTVSPKAASESPAQQKASALAGWSLTHARKASNPLPNPAPDGSAPG